MAVKISLLFAASAIRDLEDIQSYYASEGVPDAGTRLVAELVIKVERLTVHPRSGCVVPEFQLEYLREIVSPPFRIVYRYDKNKIRILRIWRSERLLKIP
jgi:plasmid stabilization system protein ParE